MLAHGPSAHTTLLSSPIAEQELVPVVTSGTAKSAIVISYGDRTVSLTSNLDDGSLDEDINFPEHVQPGAPTAVQIESQFTKATQVCSDHPEEKVNPSAQELSVIPVSTEDNKKVKDGDYRDSCIHPATELWQSSLAADEHYGHRRDEIGYSSTLVPLTRKFSGSQVQCIEGNLPALPSRQLGNKHGRTHTTISSNTSHGHVSSQSQLQKPVIYSKTTTPGRSPSMLTKDSLSKDHGDHNVRARHQIRLVRDTSCSRVNVRQWTCLVRIVSRVIFSGLLFGLKAVFKSLTNLVLTIWYMSNIFSQHPLTVIVLFVVLISLALLHLLLAEIAGRLKVRRVLPLLLNGRAFDARDDSGGENLITKELVAALGLTEHPAPSCDLHNAFDIHFRCRSHVTISIAFPGMLDLAKSIEFHTISDPRGNLGGQITVGYDFMFENRLLNLKDSRYKFRGCPIKENLFLNTVLSQNGKPGCERMFLNAGLKLANGKTLQVQALLDSGSHVDAISLKFAAHSFASGVWRYHSTKTVVCIDGTRKRAFATLETTIYVGDLAVKRTFLVLPKLAIDMILGSDFLEEHAEIDMEKLKVHRVLPIDGQILLAAGHFDMTEGGPITGFLLKSWRFIKRRFKRKKAQSDLDKLRKTLEKSYQHEVQRQDNEEQKIASLPVSESLAARIAESKRHALVEDEWRHMRAELDAMTTTKDIPSVDQTAAAGRPLEPTNNVDHDVRTNATPKARRTDPVASADEAVGACPTLEAVEQTQEDPNVAIGFILPQDVNDHPNEPKNGKTGQQDVSARSNVIQGLSTTPKPRTHAAGEPAQALPPMAGAFPESEPSSPPDSPRLSRPSSRQSTLTSQTVTSRKQATKHNSTRVSEIEELHQPLTVNVCVA